MTAILRTIEELDARLAECETATTAAELNRLFRSFCMKLQPSNEDPFSERYHAEQMELYRRLAGKAYDVSNEVSDFDVAATTRRPFPYASNDAKTVGTQLVAIGTLMRHLNLPPGGRILEFGPGWGNTTLALALSGYHVTAVDIEARFCDLIRNRARQHEVDIEVIEGDFMFAESVTEPYDAVVFFECFHHCSDHLRLLRAMDKAIKPDGRIVFAGEPISSAFPIPWGLRMEGEALWAIRTRGWLELGFNDGYFRQALASCGWDVAFFESGEDFVANVWEARRLADYVIEVPATDPSFGTPGGQKDERGIVLQDVAKNWAFCGPYCRLPAGDWKTTIRVAGDPVPSGTGLVEVCSGYGDGVIAAREISFASAGEGPIEIEFTLPEASERIQIRFFCVEPTTAVIEHFTFRRLQNASGGQHERLHENPLSDAA